MTVVDLHDRRQRAPLQAAWLPDDPTAWDPEPRKPPPPPTYRYGDRDLAMLAARSVANPGLPLTREMVRRAARLSPADRAGLRLELAATGVYVAAWAAVDIVAWDEAVSAVPVDADSAMRSAVEAVLTAVDVGADPQTLRNACISATRRR